jgi:hypothetical protein
MFWTEISYYTGFRFTAALDRSPQVPTNKRWLNLQDKHQWPYGSNYPANCRTNTSDLMAAIILQIAGQTPVTLWQQLSCKLQDKHQWPCGSNYPANCLCVGLVARKSSWRICRYDCMHFKFRYLWNCVQQNPTSETDSTIVDEEIPNSLQSGTHCSYKGKVPSRTKQLIHQLDAKISPVYFLTFI